MRKSLTVVMRKSRTVVMRKSLTSFSGHEEISGKKITMTVVLSKTLPVIREKGPLTPRGSATPTAALGVCQTLHAKPQFPHGSGSEAGSYLRHIGFFVTQL